MSKAHPRKNQHRQCPLLYEHPELPEILQKWVNEGVRQKDMPERLKRVHRIEASLRSVQRIFQECNIQTTRRNNQTLVERGAAILQEEVEDPLGRVGSWKMKEKLGLKGVHISRHFILSFRRTANPAGSAARHPVTRKLHYRGITCSGASEEWCVDGHEKLAQQMGISVWGIIDKFSSVAEN